MDWNSIFTQITNMSLTAGVIILFVLLFRRLFKNTPKVFSYVLWAVVLFRLICPVSFSSSFSLLGIFDAPTVESSRMTSSVEYVSPEIYVEYRKVDAPTPNVSESTVVQSQPETKVSIDPMDGIICIWIVGILAMAGYSLISYIRLKRKLLAVMHLRDNIYLADHIESAFVMGLARPKIYLPSSLTETEQEYIIMHEQHHIRRCDHVMKFLGFMALCVHWFNPLVWVAFIQSGKDMEMSCDEAVIKKMGEGIRAEYSASLLSLSMGRRIIAGTPLAFSEGNAKRRIINLANWKRPKMWISILVAISCIMFTVACAANPQTIEAGNDTTPASNTENDAEITTQAVKLVDTTVKPEKNVLFKNIETPYQFTSKVTAEDIDYRSVNFKVGGKYWTGNNVDLSDITTLINNVKESEIVALSDDERHEWSESNVEFGAEITLDYDEVSCILQYVDGEIGLIFITNEELSGTNPDFYGQVRWIIENDGLIEYMETCFDSVGGKEGPELVHLSDGEFTISAEKVGQYYFQTDKDKIIITVENNGGAEGNLYIEDKGNGGSLTVCDISDAYVRYELLPTFDDHNYRISAEGLDGCTITISDAEGIW